MQITLVRHGRPQLHPPRRIAGRELAYWAGRYDEAGIDASLPPPVSIRELADVAACVVASDLRRSIESARLIAPGREPLCEPLIREAGLPFPRRTGMKLDPQLWGLIARLGWLAGWSGENESLGHARLRASNAVQQLRGLCKQEGSLLVVGHGIFNALLAAELRRRGWRGRRWLHRGYWATAVYRHGGG